VSRYPSVPLSTVAAILRDLHHGATLTATAARHGVSKSTVKRCRDKARLMVRLQPPAITAARWKAAVDLVVVDGLTVTDAARRMGVSQSHLSRKLAAQHGSVAALRAPIRQAVIDQVSNGTSYYRTARLLDVTENRVRRYCAGAGVRSVHAAERAHA
jgi:transposase-like protein